MPNNFADTLEKLAEAATPGPIRVERVHDLWVELRTGQGLHNLMMADCLKKGDAELLAYLANHTEKIANALRALRAEVNRCRMCFGAGHYFSITPGDKKKIDCVRCKDSRQALSALNEKG